LAPGGQFGSDERQGGTRALHVRTTGAECPPAIEVLYVKRLGIRV